MQRPFCVYFCLLMALICPLTGATPPKWTVHDFWSAIQQAQPNNPDGSAAVQNRCQDLLAVPQGQTAHRNSGSTYTLDEYTWRDLDTERLIFPLFARHSPGLLGQLRLSGMLKQPSLDTQEILLRQQAIQELQANPQLLFDLQAFFRTFAQQNNLQDLVTMASSNPDGWLSGAPFTESVGALAMHFVWAVPTLLMATTDANFSTLQPVVPALFMMGFLATNMVSVPARLRQQHLHVRHSVELAQSILKRLQEARSPLLQELYLIFHRFARNNYTASENPTVRRYLRVQDGHFSKALLNYSFISSVTMRFMNRQFHKNQEQLIPLVTALSELEALSALAQYAIESPNFVYPTILDTDLPTQIHIRGGHHPYVLSDLHEDSVPNDVSLSAAADSTHKFTLLTGINTGGKSTYLRMIASLALLAQMGVPVPAQEMALTPLALMTNMNVNDSVEERSSFFRAQARRVAQIFTEAQKHPHVLVLMDEIFTGTSPEEHARAEEAVVQYLLTQTPHVAILATHNRALSRLADHFPNIQNFHVGDIGEEPYVLQPGVSRTRNAHRVMEEEGMPQGLLNLLNTSHHAEEVY